MPDNMQVPVGEVYPGEYITTASGHQEVVRRVIYSTTENGPGVWLLQLGSGIDERHEATDLITVHKPAAGLLERWASA